MKVVACLSCRREQVTETCPSCRDAFATAALQGLLAGGGLIGHEESFDWDAYAADSYEAADAMLRARTKSNGT